MNRLRRFMLNGMLMAAVTVIMRSAAVAFNVYISNKIGAVAMGLFTLISTVYGFGITFATSGIGLASTRLLAEAIGDTADRSVGNLPPKAKAEISCILKRCIIYSLIFGSIATLVLYALAEKIGVDILRDGRTVRSLRLLALTLIPIALSSVLSGYFSAMRRVYKSAAMQVLGQGVKIFACIALLSAIHAKDTESACTAVVAGGALAELASCAVGALLFLAERRKARLALEGRERRAITRRLLGNALPLAFSAYMRSALVTVEHILIPRGLEKSGATRDMSLAAYGTVGSMVFPLILFPSAITASFAGLLIPEMAESHAVGDGRRISGIVTSVIETVLIFAIGCAGIMMSFSLELGAAVYPSSDTAGKYILLLSPLIPIMYLDTAVDSMLKGLGEQVYTMWINIADASMSVLLVAVLLPVMGINGYIVTVYFTEILNATLSITRLLVKSRVKTRVLTWVGRPLICIILATRAAHFIIEKFSFGNVWLHMLIAVAIYLLFTVISGGIKIKHIGERMRYMLKRDA